MSKIKQQFTNAQYELINNSRSEDAMTREIEMQVVTDEHQFGQIEIQSPTDIVEMVAQVQQDFLAVPPGDVAGYIVVWSTHPQGENAEVTVQAMVGGDNLAKQVMLESLMAALKESRLQSALAEDSQSESGVSK